MVLAILLGAILGFERELGNRSAGMRTYALAAEGAALFTIAGIVISREAAIAGYGNADPSRVASTVVQGVGFLAAGVIFARGVQVRGMTTAAGIWVTASIGILCGIGYFVVAGAATIATILIFTILKVLEKRYLHDEHHPVND
jgi:putative Mg2+ transporter-C (MgtC) family protein